MSKLFWRAIKATPVALSVSLLAVSSAMAQAAPTTENGKSVDGVLNQIEDYNAGSNQTESLSQVTNVNQLRDVSPTDWAYEALRSLVDRYGCIVGYPNQTYRGSQALSRYEFAAGLNACLNQIERLIASSEAIMREDLDTINRLTQEFEAELATLSGRVDNLESRTAFLEDNQFSTTTKLNGEAIFAIADTFGDNPDTGDDDTETTFSNRIRLNFDTSFTGEDRLRTRLQARNVPEFDEGLVGTDSARLGFDGEDDNDIELSDLFYRFPIGERVTVFAGPTGLDLDDIFEVNNPYLEASGTGALSRFNRRNPGVFRGPEGAGVGAKVEITETFGANVLYLAEDASSPEEGAGLFNGSYSTGVQLTYAPIEGLDLSATYLRTYQTEGELEDDEVVGNPNLTGSTISGNAKTPFVDDGVGLATTANRFGIGGNYTFAERYNVGAFGSYIDASAPANDNLDANIWTWGANVSILDLGREGAVLSFAGGQLPKLTGGDGVTEDDETSFLIEALYKFPVNDNILVTPGAYVVLNPDGQDEDEIWVGVIRTTFKF